MSMKSERVISKKLGIKCPICKNKNKQKLLIWNNKIRSGNKEGKPNKGGWIAKSIFTKKKEKIYKCTNCDVGFLKNQRSHLENNNKLFREIFDGSNSVKKYKSFNKPRELKKFKKIQKYINFRNKKVFESNCGAAVILDEIKKKAKKTAGLDNENYKKYIESQGHLFFSNFNQIKKAKIKFDIILSLGEIEHKYDPSRFLNHLKAILSKNGMIVIRIPNYNNVYNFFIKDNFLKFDFRVSHNFYFTEKSLDYFFKINNMEILKKTGLHEYSINHLLDYIINKKRVSDSNKKGIIKQSLNRFTIENLESNMVSTSLLYIIKKKIFNKF